MTSKAPPDELQGRRPDVIQWWLSGEHQFPPPYLPMEERMIHRYFSEQEAFFDWTSNNGLYLAQSRTNRQQFDIAHDRKLFEDTLRRQQGVEYMIVGEPQPVQQGQGQGGATTTGVWNIRKQDRQRRRDGVGRGLGGAQDELETLGSYYIIGENVYQAASVGDVVGNRLLAATASLEKFYERASALPYWSPTLGHRYLLPSHTKKAVADKTGSATATPGRSREGSVMAGVETQSLRSGSVAPEGGQSASGQGSEVSDARLLWDSLNKAISYQDEYMDENPIVGEPGHLSFTSTAAAVKKRKAEEEAAATKAREQKEARSRASSPAVKVEKAPSPPAVMTESKTGGKADKDRRAQKAKRRKSRTNAQTPITPGSATVAPTPTSAT